MDVPEAAEKINNDLLAKILPQLQNKYPRLDYEFSGERKERNESLGSLKSNFAIALLAEKGKLNLDDDVRDHIPELKEFSKTITIRHLLSHTSYVKTISYDSDRITYESVGPSEEVLVVRSQPKTVLAGNRALQQLREWGYGEQGWWYDPDTGLLRLLHHAPDVTIQF